MTRKHRDEERYGKQDLHKFEGIALRRDRVSLFMEWTELGYLGLFLASFIAATIVPFSSEAVLGALLLAGFDPIISVAVATAGNTLGGMSSYALGYVGDWHNLKKWFGTSETMVHQWKAWIDRLGPYTALLCWMPIIGDVIAVGLGFFRANWLTVLLFMLIGKALRYNVIYWVLN